MPEVARKAGWPRGNGRETERRKISEHEAWGGEAWTGHSQGLWGTALSLPSDGAPFLEGGVPLGVWPAAAPNWESGHLWLGLPSVAILGWKGRLTHGPTLHCGPHPLLVVDKGCRAGAEDSEALPG